MILQYHGSSLEMALFVWDTHICSIYTHCHRIQILPYFLWFL